ncbi:MAG: tRNA 2-thiouridine(34) synthase MnmA [Rhodoluna sp.]|nr:tRNA 2-thiouridine(34) synthase MnmA [Rhodoluna sp.]
MKVLAAMSGGVDSAVAAARAVEAGHEVVGVHLALSRMPGTLRTGSRGCCTVEDSMDAQRAANKIGIPFYVWDFSERFKQEVVDDFISEYQAGRTPNPCMRCNERIKFAALLEKALALGFDALCTGHYASIETDSKGNLELHRSLAMAKDQSYVLGVLNKQQLQHSLFPLGKAANKEDIRAEAKARELSVAQKPDSYDICFIPEGDTRDWLSDKIERTEGAIVDLEGNQLATHDGAIGFTVGQRKGLNIGKPASDGKPRYVLSIRPKDNVVVVGPDEALLISELNGSKYSWCGQAPSNTSDWFEAEVQVRAHGLSHPCRVKLAGDQMVIALSEPIRGVSPGQTAVVYLGTRVLGQVTIDRTVSAVMEQV